jgi:cytochrome d ubiquinol oxidase subunit II
MIPFSVSIQDAVAPSESLRFMFYGAGLVVFPVVLLYTAGVYWVFRGKVPDQDGRP